VKTPSKNADPPSPITLVAILLMSLETFRCKQTASMKDKYNKQKTPSKMLPLEVPPRWSAPP